MHLNTRCRSSLSGPRSSVSIPGADRQERCTRGGPFVVRAALLALLARPVASTVQAQEAVRMSLAGAESAQARQTALATPGYYNVELGPTYWRFGTGLALAYNDNITLVQSGQEGDFTYSPSLNAHLLWPITPLQSLNLTLAAGYTGYVVHSRENTAYIAPNSEVSFNIYAGDFLINFHDRFSITQTSYQDPTVVGTGNYSQFQNSLGTLVTWDLNKLVVNAGYDHGSYLELTGGQSQPTQTMDTFSASAGYTVKPAMVVGLEGGAALENNSATTTNIPYRTAFEWNVGPFFQTRVSEYVTFRADAGYVVNTPQSGGALPTAQQYSGYYATVSISDRLNRFVEYTLSGGKEFSTTLLGGPVDSYSANLSAAWKVFQKVSIMTGFVYNRGTTVVSGGETFQQYGPTLNLARRWNKKLSSTFQYQYLVRDSNFEGRAYTLNVVTLSLGYQF